MKYDFVDQLLISSMLITGKMLIANQLPFVIQRLSGILPSAITWLVLGKYK